MIKTVLGLLFIVLLFAFVGCSSSKATIFTKEPSVRLDLFPLWVSNPPNSSNIHYAVGITKADNLQVAIRRSKAEGKISISQWLQVNVKEVIKIYVNDAISNSNRQNIDSLKAISVQVSQNILNGITREKIYKSEDGKVYVLMKDLKEDVINSFNPVTEIITESFEDNRDFEYENQKIGEVFET